MIFFLDKQSRFSIQLEVSFGGDNVTSIAIIKRRPEGVLGELFIQFYKSNFFPLEDSNKTVPSQVQLIQLAEGFS